jgi:hypothetical protein
VTAAGPAIALLLAQATDAAAPAFRPFWQPLPVWDYWYLLLLPLCLGVSIVYKSLKCREMRQVPREAAVIFVMILLGMVTAAAGLLMLVWLMERR